MSLKQSQKQIDDVMQAYETPYWHPLSQLARLLEESGELARLLNHLYGEKPKKQSEAQQELGGEIADVLFTLMCLANSQNIDLDEELAKVIDKVVTRDGNRFKKKSQLE